MKTPGEGASCGTSAAGASARGAISLPVIQSAETPGRSGRNAWQSGGNGRIKPSKAGRWRAAVLILVHVLIAVHVGYWLATGTTVSPVEPSESMQTLREGAINAGFIFFALAILSTLILGRFVCGWACHVVALQDLCAWMMARVRVKPKPFRARLLVLVPVVMALYMFVWPVVHRTVVRPLLANERGELPTWLGQSNPIPGLSNHLVTHDFWATFPPWFVAIPFLLVCGFATVYFLGAKGFCTYGCPYGGFFGPADLVAPIRIKVDHDKCHQCGHCTAVCTSNVRVHEEIRDYGSVIDPGCMKCMDCVSVCPNGALSLGVARPAILARPRNDEAKARAAEAKRLRAARFDPTWPEEIALAALWLVLFWAYRGMLNQVPMLMALGMAACVVFIVWKAWRLVREPNVRLQSWQLKHKGRWNWSGRFVVAGAAACVAVAGWSGWVKFHLYRGELRHAALRTPIGVVFTPVYAPSPTELALARGVVDDYRAAGPLSQGGLGWAYNADDLLHIAYAQVLVGDLPAAARAIEEIIDIGRPEDALVFQLAQIMGRLGKSDADVLAMYRRALDKHPTLHGVRSAVARSMQDSGDRLGAVKLVESVLESPTFTRRTRDQASARLGVAQALAGLGERARAATLADQAGRDPHATPDQQVAAAGLLASLEESTKAAEIAQLAAARSRTTALGGTKVNAAGVLLQVERRDAAAEQARAGVARAREAGRHIGKSDTLFNAGVLLARIGHIDEGLALVREAAAMVRTAPWDAVSVARFMIGAGRQAGNAALVEDGWSLMDAAAKAMPDAPALLFEHAMASAAAGKVDAALTSASKAATIGKDNAVLADRYAALLAQSGRDAEAARWKEEARKRATDPSRR